MSAIIDSPAGESDVLPDVTLVRGWALDRKAPFAELLLTVRGLHGTVARAGLARPDLAALNPGVAHAGASGWEATVDLSCVRGPTHLTLLGRRMDGSWAELAHTSITVTAQPGAGRRAAVFTIVQDEATFLPVWLRHYAAQVPREDIFVLDHDSGDRSTQGLQDVTVVPVHRGASFDHAWLRSVVQAFQSLLLKSYDVVIFAEVDELIVVDPRRHASLLAYLDVMQAPAARATGWNIVEHDGEAPWDSSRPVLEQRSWWHRVTHYDKTLISSVPLRWELGFHEQRTLELTPDPDLMLLHLHRVDRARCQARHRAAAAKKWSVTDVERGHGAQNRIVGADFDEWFRAGPDLGAVVGSAIPKHLIGLA